MPIASLISSARQAASTGDLPRAMSICHQALQLDPTSVAVLELGGSILARMGKVTEAVQMLRLVVQADPTSIDSLRWLTTLLVGVEGGHEAVDFGKRAVSLAPLRADLHAALGLAALGAGENDLAISCFQSATSLEPKMAGAYHNLGVAYQRDEAFEEAVEAYRMAISLSPNTWETHLHLGRTYLASNMAELALACAVKVLEMNPRSVSAMKLRADASYAASQGPNAESFLQGVILKQGESALPRALLASHLQEAGRFGEAEDALRRSLEIEPIQGLAYYLLSNNRRVTTNDLPTYDRLANILKTETMDPVEKSFGNFALGKAFDDLKQYERAMTHLDLANGETNQAQSSDPQLDTFARRSRRFAELISGDVIQAHQTFSTYPVQPIFIVGMPRSGTTLIEQILSRHPLVGAAGEQTFWRDAGRKIIDLSTGELKDEEWPRAGSRYIKLLQSIAPNKPFVTDKFPSNYVYLGLLRMVFPHAKFIHARRHPVDTSLSIYMRPFFALHESGRPRQRIVDSYRQYQQSMGHWKSELGAEEIFDVGYEQLVTSQELVVRGLLEFCGLPWDDACLHPEKGERRVITFSKWQVRQPVYTTSVERWRNYEPWLGAFRQLLEP